MKETNTASLSIGFWKKITLIHILEYANGVRKMWVTLFMSRYVNTFQRTTVWHNAVKNISYTNRHCLALDNEAGDPKDVKVLFLKIDGLLNNILFGIIGDYTSSYVRIFSSLWENESDLTTRSPDYSG